MLVAVDKHNFYFEGKHLQFVSHFFKVSLQLDGWLAFEDKLVSTKLWLTTEIWNQSSSKEIFLCISLFPTSDIGFTQ